MALEDSDWEADSASDSTLTEFTTLTEEPLTDEPFPEAHVEDVSNENNSLTDNSLQFRPSQGRTNRSGRTQIDHDVFEGLPIRQWRDIESSVGPPPAPEPIVNKHPWPELPMPRDAHLLSPMSQQLLRIARAPWLFKPAEKDEETTHNRDEDDNKESERGFTARKWTQLPRQLEEPEREYLAKRRKGLPSPYSTEATHTVIPVGPTRKTKVRKTDADGNVTIWEVIVPEGQIVEGEIIEEAGTAEEAPAPVAAAPGTVVEGVGVVNADGVVVANELAQPTPPRRRPPPPRRKPKKGPGRGKKKVQFTGHEGAALGAVGEGGVASTSGAGESAGAQLQAAAEGAAAADSDIKMGENEEDEEGEEGEDTEEGDDEDREEGELSPTPQEADPATATDTAAPPPAPSQPHAELPEALPVADIAQPQTLKQDPVARRTASSSPDLPLAEATHSRSGSTTDVKIPGFSAEAPKQDDTTNSESQEMMFPSSEVDLLSNLEKHLDKQAASGTGLPTEAPKETGTTKHDSQEVRLRSVWVDFFGSVGKYLDQHPAHGSGQQYY
ncbi:MAG: hypothetical protein M1820_006644 [Bogoriella megaspora]|nr:MAG: hypothetical protein M1820_006644 [Bogoriella megaspora]